MNLKWAAEALSDLRRIDAWLSANADPETAAVTLERIRRQGHSLLRFPRRKPRIGPERHYSQVDQTSYLLIYAVGRSLITVMRVRHNNENWR